MHRFTVVIKPDEDAFHARVPALQDCHTFAATVEEAQVNIREGIALHAESMLTGSEAPRVEHEPVFIHVDP